MTCITVIVANNQLLSSNNAVSHSLTLSFTDSICKYQAAFYNSGNNMMNCTRSISSRLAQLTKQVSLFWAAINL